MKRLHRKFWVFCSLLKINLTGHFVCLWGPKVSLKTEKKAPSHSMNRKSSKIKLMKEAWKILLSIPFLLEIFKSLIAIMGSKLIWHRLLLKCYKYLLTSRDAFYCWALPPYIPRLFLLKILLIKCSPDHFISKTQSNEL